MPISHYMKLINVCIDKINKDKFVIIHGDDIRRSTCILHDGTTDRFCHLKQNVNTNRIFKVTLEDPRLEINQILQYQVLLTNTEVQLNFIGKKVKGHLALRSQGNMYWFDIYTPESKIPYEDFLTVVEYANSISDQSDRVNLNGYTNKKWVFYYIGDDIQIKLSDKFKGIVFESIPYFQAA